MTDVEAVAARVVSLRRVGLFSGLDEEALRELAGAATEVELPRGHVLIERGQEASGLFVLEEGTLEVQIGEKRLALGPGEVLGEIALLAPGVTRTARVQASTPIRCLAIARDDFDRLLAREPTIAVALLPVLARRLADTLALI